MAQPNPFKQKADQLVQAAQNTVLQFKRTLSQENISIPPRWAVRTIGGQGYGKSAVRGDCGTQVQSVCLSITATKDIIYDVQNPKILEVLIMTLVHKMIKILQLYKV